MKIYSENKKATYDYEILEKYEAGLVLTGQEVKSIKTGHINLAGSYVVMSTRNASRSDADGQGFGAFLIGAKVPPYQPKNAPVDYNPEQQRRLLLNKKEIDYLAGRANEKGFSLIPLKVYENNGRIKLEFGVARGKKKFDKKEKIKKRDVERDISREFK
ncbi:MAG: SsrA-binding protein [Candidatus Staskawiczbacteria bacterium RIFCSPHIGHO2_02_FULL_43_16]|uniref:SsrA-binding protein n=1 Tax=Candidatus Staskawiczbacteria bacterium RIFCSPHIGHO2_01_FULL_41_41 TaxID=1802203 RepID=A0A1G2HSR6_9BACT|nr:MAG: SsrA-binding protein [Candidatus Staskawiczbacteria bacterium RIFCSPHIGHO2_01_FULL_41_41]OGZ68093.1 MAG: SsrA-binding protein [Candidatus Staskawiczbacteria bacterium RIFCSPHIGHO2_02_FULL_43_16]OGZ74831.1 MAG: SsrA-binding protein [Candidatus Staskawiczbacteria bacterium RIFCSPLOWO2_01_FULL_43_17b]